MKYVINWIPLRIRVRSRNTQPHLNEDLKKFKSYPKDFAIREKLAEIFIVQCDFTGKMEA